MKQKTTANKLPKLRAKTLVDLFENLGELGEKLLQSNVRNNPDFANTIRDMAKYCAIQDVQDLVIKVNNGSGTEYPYATDLWAKRTDEYLTAWGVKQYCNPK